MDLSETRRRVGRTGVWLPPQMLAATPVPDLRDLAARIEGLGYRSLWTGEPPATSPAAGRDVLTLSALLLAATRDLVIGTGIANITLRDPVAMHSGAATLAEAYPGRFILGLGGPTGDRPLAHLASYLDTLDEVRSRLLPEPGYPRLLAALGPKALAQAADRTDGAHPFLQPVEHTTAARATLGPDRLLIPHQAVLLEPDPATARATVRRYFAAARESAYTRQYRRLGFTDEDLAGGRSDRLVDALVAWGDEDAVAARLRAHLDAGADHVLLHPLTADLPSTVDALARLADRLPR